MVHMKLHLKRNVFSKGHSLHPAIRLNIDNRETNFVQTILIDKL